MTSIILISILAAAIAGASGYFIAYRFFSSAYAARHNKGKFASPPGGFFATFSGMPIGVFAVSATSRLSEFPVDDAGPAFIAAMLAGAAAGMIGMMRGEAVQEWGPRDNG